jgi:hypothetical protein
LEPALTGPVHDLVIRACDFEREVVDPDEVNPSSAIPPMNQNPSSIERRSFLRWLGASTGMMALGLRGLDAGEQTSPIHLATFRADVTPPKQGGTTPCCNTYSP